MTLEKVGIFTNFVPFVSIPLGIRQVITYHNQSKKKQNIEEINKTASEAYKIAYSKLSNLERSYNNKLWKASIVTSIPGANIIAAFYSAFIFYKLSETREMLKDPSKLIEKEFKKHNLNLFNDLKKNELMFELLSQEPKIASHLIPFFHGFISGLKGENLPSVQKLVEMAPTLMPENIPLQLPQKKDTHPPTLNTPSSLQNGVNASPSAFE